MWVHRLEECGGSVTRTADLECDRPSPATASVHVLMLSAACRVRGTPWFLVPRNDNTAQYFPVLGTSLIPLVHKVVAAFAFHLLLLGQ